MLARMARVMMVGMSTARRFAICALLFALATHTFAVLAQNLDSAEPEQPTSDKAAQLATDLMTAHADLKGLIAVASSTCPGVGQAIETAGKVGKVIGAGYCSPNTARAYIKSGAMPFTVLWDPAALGYLTVWAGKQLIDGKPFAATNNVPGMEKPVSYDAKTGVLLLGDPTVFTAKNVDEFKF